MYIFKGREGRRKRLIKIKLQFIKMYGSTVLQIFPSILCTTTLGNFNRVRVNTFDIHFFLKCLFSIDNLFLPNRIAMQICGNVLSSHVFLLGHSWYKIFLPYALCYYPLPITQTQNHFIDSLIYLTITLLILIRNQQAMENSDDSTSVPLALM